MASAIASRMVADYVEAFGYSEDVGNAAFRAAADGGHRRCFTATRNMAAGADQPFPEGDTSVSAAGPRRYAAVAHATGVDRDTVVRGVREPGTDGPGPRVRATTRGVKKLASQPGEKARPERYRPGAP